MALPSEVMPIKDDTEREAIKLGFERAGFDSYVAGTIQAEEYISQSGARIITFKMKLGAQGALDKNDSILLPIPAQLEYLARNVANQLQLKMAEQLPKGRRFDGRIVLDEREFENIRQFALSHGWQEPVKEGINVQR